jgi:predicted anti-sigma-YlaC factor YlaD
MRTLLHPTTEALRSSLDARFPAGFCVFLGVFLVFSGCSIKRVAVNQVGDALASGGTSFASDDDPELVKAAAPFSLKLMESLLDENPRHQGLLLATSSGFTQYAYAFVQQDADELEEKDLTAANDLRTRARRLYIRARNYGIRGLEARHPGFEKALRVEPKHAVAETRKKDVPLLYWTAVSWAAAVSLSKDNPDLIGDLPLVEALIDRALELDEAFDAGAIHTFLISYEMSRANGIGDPATRSRQHFERAVALSGGHQAGPYVALAEAVSVQKQDLNEFKSLLNQALAINVDARPESRLVNLVMQRRAKWLLTRTDELFLNTNSQPQPK